MDMPENIEVKPVGKSAIRPRFILALIAFIAVLGVARVHLIVGGDLPFPKVVMKNSWGFSETVINIDKITGMPRMFAYAQFPLGIPVLQREGFIETEAEIDARLEQESARERAQFEAEHRKAAEELDAITREANEDAEAAIAAAEEWAAQWAPDAGSADTEQESPGMEPELPATEEDRQAAIDAYTRELQLLQEFDQAVGEGGAAPGANAPLETWGIKTTDYEVVLAGFNGYQQVSRVDCSKQGSAWQKGLCSRKDFADLAWLVRRLNIYATENATKTELDNVTAFPYDYGQCADVDCLGRALKTDFYAALDDAGLMYLLEG